MAKLLMPKHIYQSLFDAFFVSASVNCNAFLEFRVQCNEVRVKWSDTQKPYNAAYPNRPSSTVVAQATDISRPPPSFLQHVNNGQKESSGQLRKKRRHAATLSPTDSAIKRVVSDDKTAPVDGPISDVGYQPPLDSPETVREDRVQIFPNETVEISALSLDDDSDNEDDPEYTEYSCDFASKNLYNVLNSINEDEMFVTSSVTKDSMTKTATDNFMISCPPCEQSHKCYSCFDECEQGCDLNLAPGPITMNCHICKKKIYQSCIPSFVYTQQRESISWI